MFSNDKPNAFMSGNGNYPSYRTDENCSLVHGWEKITTTINHPIMP